MKQELKLKSNTRVFDVEAFDNAAVATALFATPLSGTVLHGTVWPVSKKIMSALQYPSWVELLEVAHILAALGVGYCGSYIAASVLFERLRNHINSPLI